MTINTQSQTEIVKAIGLLMTRRGNTVDPAEKVAINSALDKLNGNLQDLDQAELLQAAKIIAAASDELEKVVASAKLGPFDTYLADLQVAISNLQGLQGQMHASEALPSADAEPAKSLTPREIKAVTPDALPRPPKASRVYAELKPEYETFFEACTINAKHKNNIDFYTSRLKKFQQVYKDVGTDIHIPWYFIGIIHAMECGFNFGTHLHNGDPLTAKTVHVPTNRPAIGNPPFTWRDSARDALIFDGYSRETDWSTPRILFLFEKYNGFGYRKVGVPSPYLWSFSNLYTKGKFVQDGHFDADAVSAQCGAAVMLKTLQVQGEF